MLKGNLKDLNEIPPCGLVEAFACNLETLPLTLHQTFIEGLRQRLPQRSPIQEQYQEQEQEQEQETAHRADRPSLRRVSSPENKATNKDGSEGHDLVALARQTLKLTDPDAPIEHLVDTFLNAHPRSTSKRAEVIAALNRALSERRGGRTAMRRG